jgi:hypothetical protein
LINKITHQVNKIVNEVNSICNDPDIKLTSQHHVFAKRIRNMKPSITAVRSFIKADPVLLYSMIDWELINV